MFPHGGRNQNRKDLKDRSIKRSLSLGVRCLSWPNGFISSVWETDESELSVGFHLLSMAKENAKTTGYHLELPRRKERLWVNAGVEREGACPSAHPAVPVRGGQGVGGRMGGGFPRKWIFQDRMQSELRSLLSSHKLEYGPFIKTLSSKVNLLHAINFRALRG